MNFIFKPAKVGKCDGCHNQHTTDFVSPYHDWEHGTTRRSRAPLAGAWMKAIGAVYLDRSRWMSGPCRVTGQSVTTDEYHSSREQSRPYRNDQREVVKVWCLKCLGKYYGRLSPMHDDQIFQDGVFIIHGLDEVL